MNIVFIILKTCAIILIGAFIIKYIIKFLKRVTQKVGFTQSSIYYLEIIAKFLLYFILITIAANSIGLNTGSLVALVASLGLAIALALRGSLTDLASGLMIVITNPIKIGDRVYLEGIEEYLQVVEIKLFNTYLINRRNTIVIVPNVRIMQQKVENLSKRPYVYTDVEISVAYNANINLVKTIIENTLDKQEYLLVNEKYIIGISKLNQSSIDLLISVPVRAHDYFVKQLVLREEIYKALREREIFIPFPQTEVRILNDNILK